MKLILSIEIVRYCSGMAKKGAAHAHVATTGRGRPALPIRKQRTTRLQIPLAASELDEIREAAARVRDDPAPWARKILLLAAEGRLVLTDFLRVARPSGQRNG
jgi:hypothetical protein